MRSKLVLPLFMGAIISPHANLVFAEGQPTAKRSNRLLEEVVVTAQKREENSQDVPISIQAFSGEKLEAFGIETTADLQKITPGLTFTYIYGYTMIYLRGVGSEAFLPNADPSITTYVDGMNIVHAHGKQDALGPVERIEILKGPQGTLFGRNATGGAISIVTADAPQEGFVGSLTVNRGNVDTDSYQLYLAAHLTDDISFTLAGYDDRHDNYGFNIYRGQEQRNWKEDYTSGGRLKLTWDITDTLSVMGIGSYTNQFIGGHLRNENSRPSMIFGAGAEVDEPDRITHNNIQGGSGSITTLYGAVINWNPGPVDVKFLYSDQESYTDWGYLDYDGTEEDRARFWTHGQYNEQKTYELQITSNEETWLSDKLEWVAGLYRLEAGGGFDPLFFSISPELVTGAVVGQLPDLVVNLLPVVNKLTLESAGVIFAEADSAYWQGTWTFSPEFNATLGLRYQDETRGISKNYLDVINTLFGDPGIDYYRDHDRRELNTRVLEFSPPDVSEKTIAPRLAIQWFLNDSVQIYASASRAFKSPTYNIVNFFSEPDLVEKATTTSFELGFKSDLFEDSFPLRLNGAVFETTTEKPLSAIVSLTSGGVVRFINAGESVTKGAEMDFVLQPMPNWNPGLAITGGATYLDAIYTEFTNGAGYDQDTGLYFGNDSPTGDNARDFSGNDVPRTPEFSSNVSLNQIINVGMLGSFEVGVDYAFKGEFYFTPQNSPHFKQPNYELWSARLSWMYDPWGLNITGYINNIKDKDYYATMLENDFGRLTNLAPPKLMGVRVKWDFDAIQ